jgi:glutamine---fructose-6-phosphate transaminase (isomerizing)
MEQMGPDLGRILHVQADRDFAHDMLREIHEQPQALWRTLQLYLRGDALRPETIQQLKDWARPSDHVVIAASGSSRHAGLAGEIWLEELSGVEVDVEYASEYSFGDHSSQGGSACLVLSQSGETADTLGALRDAKRHGWKTLAITNAANSTMAREADVSMPLGAGPERAIPATKSFTCQLAALYIVALCEGASAGRFDERQLQILIAELWAQCEQMQGQLAGWQERMAGLTQKYAGASTFLFLGSGIHYAIAREGALKLKEASYVHAEGYPAGELRHGPNALVSDAVPVVAIATVEARVPASVQRYEKTLRLLRDLKAQGARVIAIANAGDEAVAELATDIVAVKPAPELLLPLTEVVPLQLFAYYMALERGVNMDRPRNLTKAVVEQ